MFRRIRRALMAVAVGAMPLATTVDCALDGRDATLYIDRYDDHDHGFFDFLFGWDEPYYEEEVFIYDDCCF